MRKTNMVIIFRDLVFNGRDTPKIRGSVASKFPGYNLLHQHIDGDRLRYLYPKIQYKTVNHMPMIVGIDEGVDVLKKIYSEIGELKINGMAEEEARSEISISVLEDLFGLTTDSIYYIFLSPWLALNKKNYERYQRLGSWGSRDKLLTRILLGNILSMSKGLGYTVPSPIEARIRKIREVQTSLKGNPMLGFLGTFSVNFEIPDYFGIGKSVSRGFGTVKKIRE